MIPLRRALIITALLSLFFFCAAAEARDIVVYYTSDAHGSIFSGPETIGLERISGIAGATPNSLLLDAGDFLHGEPVAVMTQGKDVVRLMKKAGYFAATAGNHEFTYLPGVLEQRVKEAHTPPDAMRVISANVFTSDGSLLLPAEAETVLDGAKICVFGLTTTDSLHQVRPATVTGLAFTDPLAEGRETAARQKERGCALVIALTHLGSERGSPGNSRALGEAVQDIDLIIDGHSHVVLEEALPRQDGRAAMLVSPGSRGRLLGRLAVSLDDETGRVTAMRNHFINPAEAAGLPVNEELLAEMDALRGELDKRLAVPVAELRADLPASRREARQRETAFGDLCADALRSAYGDELALCNGGGLRSSLHKGVLSREDLMRALPFNDVVVSLEVTGRELLDVLEHGFSRLPETFGGFPQVSGFTVRVVPANPPGSRVVAVTLADGSALDPDRVYSLSTNAFLADGGDGYPHLAGKSKRKTFLFFDKVFLDFLAGQDTSVYAVGPAGRIVME